MHGIAELEAQERKTNNKNIEFDSCFEGEKHVIVADTNSESTKLNISLDVKEAGYLKNAKIKIENANFRIKQAEIEGVQSISENSEEILLDQIKAGEGKSFQFEIEPIKEEKVAEDNFAKETTVKLEGAYIDGKGNEKSIEGEVKVRAEWTSEAKAKIEADIIKSIPFSVGNKKGEILQMQVKTNIDQEVLPIKENQISIQAPKINGILPEEVTIIAKSTKATNGKEGLEFTNENYSYDKETGKTILKIENPVEEGKITWQKGMQDEFIITYVYSKAGIYEYVTSNPFIVNTQAEVAMKLYANQEKEAISQAKIEKQLQEPSGDIISLNPSITQDILPKAYIYANYDKDQKDETEYTQKYQIEVSVANLIDNIQISQDYDTFIIDGKSGYTTINGTNYAYNKKIKINETIFKKILGEEGYIKIANEKGEEIQTINKETQKDEQGNLYIDIANINNNKIYILTSKPQTEGILEIYIDKAIKGEVGYSKEQMINMTALKTQGEILALNNNQVFIQKEYQTETNFKEPNLEATLEINKQNLSTIVPNENVEIKAILRTDSLEYALYKNPTIEIELPEYIQDLNIKDMYMAYEDELKSKQTQIIERDGHKVIIIELEGTQTKYQVGSISRGSNIIIVADITAKKLTPTTDTKIKMTYTNQNETIQEKTKQIEVPVSFIAPTGLVTVNEISGYNNQGSTITSISGEEQTGKIDYMSEAKTATVKGTFINNYQNNLADVKVLGNLPVTDVKENTFDANLVEPITLEGAKGTVYYSSKANANGNLSDASNNWLTKPSQDAKSYLIVLDEEMEKGKIANFEYKVAIPENLDYSETVKENYQVNFTNQIPNNIQAQSETAPDATITTGEGVKLKANLKVDETGRDAFKNNEYIRFIATIENTGSIDAENTKLNFDVPEGLRYVEYDEGNTNFDPIEGEFNGITIGTIKVGEKKEYEFFLQVYKENIKGTESKTFNANIVADKLEKQITTNEVSLNIMAGDFEVICKTSIVNNAQIGERQKIYYDIFITNKNQNKQATNNNILTIPLPKNSEIVDKNVKNSQIDTDFQNVDFKETSEGLTVNLGKIEYEAMKVVHLEYIIAKGTTGNFNTEVSIKADGTDTSYSNRNNFTVKPLDLEIVQEQVDKEYVKEQEMFKYKFKLTNTSETAIKNIVLEDILSPYIQFDEHYKVSDPANANNPEYKQVYICDENGNDYGLYIAYLKDEKARIELEQLEAKETVYIKIIVKADFVEDDTEVINYATIYADGIAKKESNKITHYIEYVPKMHGETEEKAGRYKITGTAWLDKDQNGQRDIGETLLSNIRVMLINTQTNQIVKDVDNGQDKIIKTNASGKYEFSNILPGKYIVVFVYDASKYSITEYQKQDVASTVNSDAMSMKMDIDGKQTNVGATDTITVSDKHIRSIDIGLYEQKKFDLKLEKYITKITVQNGTGTNTYDYGETNLAKRDLIAKEMNRTNVIVEYKIKITNEGQLEGYVKKIVDYIPKELKFSSELNMEWYLGQDGNAYNASLANTKINPGETKEVTLVLTKKMQDSDKLGLISNKAELYEVSNDYGVTDIDSEPGNGKQNEDDISIADLYLSIRTGKSILLVVITITTVLIISIGVYIIKRKVID